MSPDSKPQPPAEDLLDSAFRLLSARARSVEELRGRLLRKGFNASDVARGIRWLMDRDFLNDEVFARSLTRDRIRFSPRSPFLLKREISTKGVRSSLADDVVEGVLAEEGVSASDLSAMAAEGWVRKQAASVRAHLVEDRFSPEREKARRRLYGFLARRGFMGESLSSGLEAGEEKARAMKDEARKAGG